MAFPMASASKLLWLIAKYIDFGVGSFNDSIEFIWQCFPVELLLLLQQPLQRLLRQKMIRTTMLPLPAWLSLTASHDDSRRGAETAVSRPYVVLGHTSREHSFRMLRSLLAVFGRCMMYALLMSPSTFVCRGWHFHSVHFAALYSRFGNSTTTTM